MANIDVFMHDVKQYLALGAEKRMNFGKTFTKGYYQQTFDMGISESEALEMMHRLVAYLAASDGEISKSEYQFVNCALFEIDAKTFLESCKQYVRPTEVQILKEFAHKQYKHYGYKSFMYILGICVIAANGEVSVDEQKKFCNLFGVLDKE